MSDPTGWDSILDPGETILWQGRPDQAFHVGFAQVFVAVFGLFFAGFALFWMVMAAQAGGAFWMFGLIHFAVGAALAFGSLYGATYTRRNTWYTLTDRRAFVATNLWYKGKTLKSYPITGDTTVEFRAGPPDSVLFAHEERRGSKGRRYTVPVGFERIDDGHEIMRIIRKRIHNVADLADDEAKV